MAVEMKTLIAMSGGVDSSVVAHLLKEAGHECIGAMMKLYEQPSDIIKNEKTCCSLSDAEDARAVADALGIPFYVFNFKTTFSEEVMERFVKAYIRGTTPNPCIDCNRFVKFKKFLLRAEELECTHIATGHYAQIEKSNSSGRFLLKRGNDHTKDQSYVLYAMTQDQLSHTLFPLGEFTKEEVRKMAEKQKFVNANKRDSQDICFAPDGDYAGFIQRSVHNLKIEKGKFINRDNRVLGEHKGIIHYTVGQRKGIGAILQNPEPLYVTAINPEENTVMVGVNEELYSKTVKATDINLIPFDKLDNSMRVTAKVRYSFAAQPATLWQEDDDLIRLEFDTSQRAITPGQAVVIYDGDIVVGGGTIIV